MLDPNVRLVRNEFAVAEATFRNMVPNSQAVFYIQFPGGAEVDISLLSIAVFQPDEAVATATQVMRRAAQVA